MNAPKIPRDSAIGSVNTIYSVFLGLFGTFLISQRLDTNGDVASVVFQLNAQNRLPVLTLGAYYIFDWLSANITVGRGGSIHHYYLVLVLLLVALLGVLVVSAFAPDHGFYFLLAGYAFVVPWWDPVLRGRTMVSFRAPLHFVIVLARVMLGILVAVLVLLHELLRRHSDHAALLESMWIVLILLVLVKAARYALLAFEEAPAPEGA